MNKQKFDLSLYDNNKTNISVEVVSFLYGSLIVRLVKDFNNDINEINKQTEQMGYNIGLRLINDIIASQVGRNLDSSNPNLLNSLIISTLSICLGLNGELKKINEKEFHFLFDNNLLALYVEIPENLKGLIYSNLINGLLRGVCEIANFKIESKFIKDKLNGDDINEIQINLLDIIEERFVDDEA
jgi:hypothetical protein